MQCSIMICRFRRLYTYQEVYVTRSRKRDRSRFFVKIEFLVWIVSSTSVEYSGAGSEFKYYSEAELWLLQIDRVIRNKKI